MAQNDFSKEERVAFELLMEGFEDALVLSREVSVRKMDQVMMERTGDVLWRPQPYIVPSYAGQDQTPNFVGQTQLSVPTVIDQERSAPWIMTATELRDALQENRLGQAAKERLASDINLRVMDIVCNQGTIVVTKTTAAADFGDVANIEAAMNRVGIPYNDRKVAFSTPDYNGLAKDLANRANMVEMTKEAYRRGYVGMVASFDTYKLDYANLLPAALGSGITMDTRASVTTNFYIPAATKTVSGVRGNVDNRYQQVTVSSTTNVVAGDAFTIAGINEVHHITKRDTGSLKTFRVISVDSATLMTISPPIISNAGGSQPEIQYQNVVTSASATAALVFLNTVKKPINPFWCKDAVELTPGRYAVPEGAGAMVLRSSTEQGIEVTMTKQFDIQTLKTRFRLDVRFGVTLLQPEMSGYTMFSQT